MAREVSFRKAWLWLQVIILLLTVAYQSLWLFAKVTNGDVVDHIYGGVGRGRSITSIVVQYQANYQAYEATYFVTKEYWKDFGRLKVHYLPFAPEYSRPANTPHALGSAAIIFAVQFLVTGIFFAFPNTIFPKRSRILFISRFPYIKFLLGRDDSLKETKRKVKRAFRYVEMLEHFLPPPIIACFVAIFSYPFSQSWTPGFVIIALGFVVGVWRVYEWRKRLNTHG